MFGTYSCCSFSGVLSFAFDVGLLSIERLGCTFNSFHLGIKRNFRQNMFFEHMSLQRFCLQTKLCWQPYPPLNYVLVMPFIHCFGCSLAIGHAQEFVNATKALAPLALPLVSSTIVMCCEPYIF